MKYVGNPVVVDAWAIKSKRQVNVSGLLELVIDKDGVDEVFRPELGMTSRFSPEPGDYLVQQADGYLYLNPKDVFERKYSKQVSIGGGKEPIPQAPQAQQSTTAGKGN